MFAHETHKLLTLVMVGNPTAPKLVFRTDNPLRIYTLDCEPADVVGKYRITVLGQDAEEMATFDTRAILDKITLFFYLVEKHVDTNEFALPAVPVTP